MHPYSFASGVAIARLLADDVPGLEEEAVEYVERARVTLALDNSALAAAMMFAQPLLARWKPHW